MIVLLDFLSANPEAGFEDGIFISAGSGGGEQEGNSGYA